ncbi:hypothetical protein [Shinella zoogloeoides]|uniref:hypothetical protein n=1 Tax=Shinella zoogloeoides TaxID=352475 RepID=UPI00273EB605|nr:hypothetical protein [Shinella zoogloeoides]WLR90965.1 hypothetical protein Q9316_00005 [Shinella zoogloeoides]
MAKNKAQKAVVETVVVDTPITDHEAAILSALEGDNANTDPVQSDAGPAPVDGAVELSLPQIADSYTEDEKLAMAKKVAKGFEDRSAYEKQKNPNNDRIHKNLDKTRAKLTLPSAAAILIAAQVEPDFINRSQSEGSRFNVYAADKLADLVKGLRDGALTNKINIAICRSLFAFRAAGEKFTGEMAKAAACDKMKVSAAMQKILIRHTVDPGTMSTQTSSTMTALQTMGIVKNTGSFRAPVYELTDTPQTKRLQEVLAA